MYMDILNIDEYVKKFDIKEITSANIFAVKSTEPDPEGLGSYEIFGRPGSYERSHSFAYIDLGDIFIHPHVLNVLVSLKKIIADVVNGNGEFYIYKHNIVKLKTDETPPPGASEVGAGCRFLYENWDSINFGKEKKLTPIVKDRVTLIEKLSKEEIFITKFLVIPPFYRDVDMSTNKKNEINIMYQRLISLASVIRSTGSLMLFQSVSDAHKKLIATLTELYLYFVEFTAGTKGFVHKHVMGKATDFSARMIISTPKISGNTYKDMEVSFDHSAVPLHVVVKCFAPFIVYEVKRIVLDRLAGNKFINIRNNKTNKFDRYELADNFTEELLSDNIYKLIDLYYESKEHRLDYYTLLGENNERIPFTLLESQNANDKIKDVDVKPITLCELFYIAAMNTVSNKCIYVTRYPVEDYHNTYPSLMNIIPCTRYVATTVSGKDYPRFPVIDPDKDLKNINAMFTDTLRVFPTYLSALGADFDGDMVSVQGVFGNDDVKDYIYSKVNIINIAGTTMRSTGEVTAHTVFALTRKE